MQDCYRASSEQKFTSAEQIFASSEMIFKGSFEGLGFRVYGFEGFEGLEFRV
jgi:hypothetical protein